MGPGVADHIDHRCTGKGEQNPNVSAFSHVKHVGLNGGSVNAAGRDINHTTYHHYPGSIYNDFSGAQHVNNGINYGNMHFGPTTITTQIPAPSSPSPKARRAHARQIPSSKHFESHTKPGPQTPPSSPPTPLKQCATQEPPAIPIALGEEDAVPVHDSAPPSSLIHMFLATLGLV
ncbi:hypothetical protein BKA70DRAFT_1253416 [Coprinopsis sp. MPI-PUGE-AT-0042]|nr:hypothetical protein BKA70DRAFT_1253416 [Coprinopsis sp. MPI-PUGE-AT-0042]